MIVKFYSQNYQISSKNEGNLHFFINELSTTVNSVRFSIFIQMPIFCGSEFQIPITNILGIVDRSNR